MGDTELGQGYHHFTVHKPVCKGDMMRKMILSMICFMCFFMYRHAMDMELKTVYQKDAPPRYITESSQVFGICVDIINVLNSRLREQAVFFFGCSTHINKAKRKLRPCLCGMI